MKWIILVLMAACVAGCASNGDAGELDYAEVEQSGDGNFEADPDYYADNAQRFIQAGEYRRALTQFRKVLEQDPNDNLSRLGEGYCLYHIGLDLAARGSLDRASRSFQQAEGVFANLWVDRAGESLERSTQDPEAWHWKSLLGLAETERAIASLAKVELDRIDAALPRIEDPEKVRSGLERQTKLRKRREIYNRKARERFSALSSMEYPAPDSLLNLADIEYVIGNEPAAERAYLDYLSLTERSVEIWDERRDEAMKNLESKSERRVALAAIEKKRESALEKNLKVLQQLAEIKFRKGNYGASLEYLERALDIDPERYVLNVPMAECHYELGSFEKGLEHIDRYIRLSEEFDDDTHRAYKLRSKLVNGLERVDG